MALSAGDELGPYRILAPVGAGGMGSVYKAHDTRLLRDVAIKVAAARFSERFEREARAIAALNHPNICTLHDIGPNYLVMEYVEGKSPKGPLPLDQAVRIAAQIAAALEAAHAKGIIHRDLKPGNIMIKEDGAVKVLDFGLAKMTQAESIRPDDPTLTLSLTGTGTLLGTAAYMAPEQAEGKPVDKRADIWAFGVVLHELLSGERLFKAATAQETLVQVLTKTLDLSRVPVEAHPLLRRCLERDPNRRLRDIGDAMPLLEQAPVAVTAPVRASWLWPSLAATAILAAFALAFVHFRETPATAPALVRFRIPFAAGLRPYDAATFSLSPDGNTIAFPAAPVGEGLRIWIQPLDSFEPRPIPGSELPGGTGPPIWSPDSKTVVFQVGRKLRKSDLTGNVSQVLCDTADLVVGGSWSQGHVILFDSISTSGIKQVPAAGGTPVSVTAVSASRQERAHMLPFFLPDGRHFLYLRVSRLPENIGIYVGSLDNAPDAQPLQRLLATSTGAQFVPGPKGVGKVLFLREGALMAQDFNTGRLELTGEARLMAASVGNTRDFPFFASSASGNLVYRATPTRSRQMTFVDRQGRQISQVGEPMLPAEAPILNPSGSQFAISRWDLTDRTNDVFLYTLSPYRSLRLARGPNLNASPVWSTDGARVAYASTRSGHNDLYQANANGDGQQTPLLESAESKFPTSWSRDGYLLYIKQGTTTGRDLWILPPNGAAKPFPFLESPSNEWAGQFSPDGRWIAYLSDESGATELYVRAFTPGAGSAGPAAGPRIPISTRGANMPRWRADGRELFYTAPNGNLMAVPITLAPAFAAGQPSSLFPAPAPSNWDVKPDGQTFLFAIPVGEQVLEPFTVLLNWQAGLKK